HVLRRHRVHVVVERDRGDLRADVEAPRHGDDPGRALRLDLGPALVRAAGETDVLGPVVGQADDPAVVLAGAVAMTERELLEAEHAVTEPAAQPVGGPGADRPEAHDDRVPVVAHVRIVAGAVPWPPGRRARRLAAGSRVWRRRAGGRTSAARSRGAGHCSVRARSFAGIFRCTARTGGAVRAR